MALVYDNVAQYLASSPGLFICVGVEKRPGIDCNAHA